ncbi:hypothetical protein GQ44DRAFT_592634, partial [Phaeosphaeriaceae sp. PMI808]
LSFSSFVSSATTVGPLAPVSIQSLEAYSIARPCAAGCLRFQGIWVCGVNAGYHDLGKDLGCGCSPTNACWCSAGLQSSATSYISSCISAGCKSLGNIDRDVKGMLDLYGGYCATANVNPSSKPAQISAVTTSTAQETSNAAMTRSLGASNPAAAGATSAVTSGAVIVHEDQDKTRGGLSKPAVIGLGVGLGVGIPLCIIGMLAAVLFWRKRKIARQASATSKSPS